MRGCLTLLFVLFFGISFAQTVHRTFLPVNPKEEKIEVLSNVQSTFVIKVKADQSVDVISFDHRLKELWGIGIVLKYPVLQVAELFEDELVLLISDAKRRNFALLEIDRETGHYSFSEYTISKGFAGEQLARNGEQFWVRGWIGEEPVAFRMESTTRTFKTLPLGYSGRVNGIAHFAYDPIRQELDIVLETEENGYQAYLLRSIDTKGNLTRNQLFSHPDRNITDFHIQKLERGLLQAIGTLSKKKAISGLAWFTLDKARLERKEWDLKGLTGMNRTWQLEDHKLVEKETKGLKTIETEIDEVFFAQDGEVVVALETFEKDYEVRGLLQRESDEQSLIDQLDLNRYGRRDFDTDESTLNNRVDNFSNTEAATYRYRDVIIDRVQEQGNRHSQTVILKIDNEQISGLRIKAPANVNSTFSIKEKNLIDGSYWLVDEKGLRTLLLSQNPELENHNLSLGPYMKNIGTGEFLNFGFLVNDRVFYLMLQRIGL